MACYKLTSCTAGNSTILWSSDPGFGSVISPVSLSNHGGTSVSYMVEVVEAPCNCQPTDPTVNTSFLIFSPGCTSPYLCYKLQDCQDPQGPFIYVNNNLNPYVVSGQTVSIAEQPGHCYNVIGVTDPIECDNALPTIITSTCVEPCVCTHCYEATNCEFPNGQPWIIIINSPVPLTPGNVIQPTPPITQPGYLGNCWTIGLETIPCNAGTVISSAVVQTDCQTCLGPNECYSLTDCDGVTVYYSNSALGAYVGTYISSPSFPGHCFYVAVAQSCPNPVVFDNPSPCSCPCYTLTDCAGLIPPFNTISNLAAYVGQVIQIDENGGCNGPCFLVSVNPGPCTAPRTATVSQGCVPCPPCNDCYLLIDCNTRLPYLTLSNPTANGVDLSTMIGQVIGQVCLGPNNTECTDGCWEIQQAQSCSGSVSAYVYNIFQDCAACNAICYKVTNCQTLQTIYINYTVPHPTLPNPSSLVGQTLGSLCFEAPTGCLTGCWFVELNTAPDCPGAVDWTTVVSYTEFDDCDACLPKCYLLTECAPAVTPPFIVSNDLSLYVGFVAKICDSNGVCHCYHVELAQTCDGAIVIDNANASFTTCEECLSCDCPPGYTKIDDHCQKVTTVPATLNPTVYNSAAALPNLQYGMLGTRFYPNITSLPYPLTAVTGPDRFVDLSTTNVPYTSLNTTIWGPTFFPYTSRLDTVGIWTNAPCVGNCPPVNEWIGFAKCIDIPTSGTYCVGIAGDDCIRLKLDGVVIAQATIGLFDFNYWHVFELNLTAGTHVIVLECLNTGYAAAFGAEIYQTTLANLQTINTIPALQAVTIFSTFPMRSTPTPFQTGENSGYSCPPGSTLNLCGEPSCTVIETIPFVPCAPTFLVTDCAGLMPPFTTNTDLSAYVGTGTYRTCINSTQYSTTCFLLRDCNRLVGDVITTSNMAPYLWTSVPLNEYPGSCFLVLPLPANTICLDNPVTLSPAQCDCPTAQAPWPDGCYCVTVEAIPPVPAPEFPGVFTDTPYNCCEDCLRVCYLLTDCQGALDPVVVCNDLAQYVGQIIQIEGCGDTCWQVAIANNCDGNTIFAGAITAFDSCQACLPVPPQPPALELHPRRIKPGYFSPNCKVPLEYIEKVNCTFAKQVYDSMLVSRYGITVCCDNDLPTWANRKAILDYEMLIDPSLCKSTLCYCPKPCLIGTEIVLLPTCVAPAIVSAVIDLPCPAPVITGVVIEYDPVPADCICYTVTPNEFPSTFAYIDCCCKVQFVTTDLSEPISLCASTVPVVLNGAITVVQNGPCDAIGPCNPPVCYCWKVTNSNGPGSPDGSAIFDDCCTGPFCPSLFAMIAAGQSVSNCSFNAPVVSPGMIVENMGPCVNGSCVPPVCQCYSLTLNDGGSLGRCEFAYTDCNGVPQLAILVTGQTVYLCSQTGFTPACPQVIDYTVTVVNNPCGPDGTCAPPVVCNCYEIIISGVPGVPHGYQYRDCNGVDYASNNFPGTYYLCAQSINTFLDPEITVNVLPVDCAHCISPACVCYQVTILTVDGQPIQVQWTDCQGQSQNTYYGDGSYKICATTAPFSFSPGLTVTSTPLNCGNGECV